MVAIKIRIMLQNIDECYKAIQPHLYCSHLSNMIHLGE